ncbi:unnamed protein product, partial [Phaeothamnion confervicola]
MRMNEAVLFPAIPHPNMYDHYREVMSMSDYVHTGQKTAVVSRVAESRLLFAACYVLSLLRALIRRLIPWCR